jgi:hypothetical protein
MGVYLVDQYTLLHLAVGVIAYFWSVPFVLGLLVHIGFEFVENTGWGVDMINNYITGKGLFRWPGGKYRADTLTNQTGDNLAFAGGWGLAWWLDTIGQGRGWYPGHLAK